MASWTNNLIYSAESAKLDDAMRVWSLLNDSSWKTRATVADEMDILTGVMEYDCGSQGEAVECTQHRQSTPEPPSAKNLPHPP